MAQRDLEDSVKYLQWGNAAVDTGTAGFGRVPRYHQSRTKYYRKKQKRISRIRAKIQSHSLLFTYIQLILYYHMNIHLLSKFISSNIISSRVQSG
jgi:hypothetical protein